MAYTNQANTYGYQHGTAAPKAEPERIREAKAEYKRNGNERVEERVNALRKVRSGISFVQVIAVTLCLAVMLAVAGVYILSVSEKENHKTSVETLKKNVQELSLKNAKLEDEIAAAIDYEEIYTFAIEQGMQVPDKQQIVRYNTRSAEYVSKGAEIPNE